MDAAVLSVSSKNEKAVPDFPGPFFVLKYGKIQDIIPIGSVVWSKIYYPPTTHIETVNPYGTTI